VIDCRWLLESKPERCPLRPWNTNPARLFRQCLVHEFVALVQTDLCFRLQFFQRRYTADVMVENMLARDAEEGIGAFIEKRTPGWEDR